MQYLVSTICILPNLLSQVENAKGQPQLLAVFLASVPIDSWLISTVCGPSFEPDDLRISIAPGQMEHWLADESKDCSFSSSCLGSQINSDCLSVIQNPSGSFFLAKKEG